MQSVMHEQFQQKSLELRINPNDQIAKAMAMKQTIKNQRQELESDYLVVNEFLSHHSDAGSIKPPPRGKRDDRKEVYEEHAFGEKDLPMSETTSITGSASSADTVTMVSGMYKFQVIKKTHLVNRK